MLFFAIYLLPIIIAVTWTYRTSEKRSEDAFVLKLVGYFFLGTLVIWIDFLPLPVGLAVGLFILKPNVNGKSKKLTLITGCATALISHLFIF